MKVSSFTVAMNRFHRSNRRCAGPGNDARANINEQHDQTKDSFTKQFTEWCELLFNPARKLTQNAYRDAVDNIHLTCSPACSLKKMPPC